MHPARTGQQYHHQIQPLRVVKAGESKVNIELSRDRYLDCWFLIVLSINHDYIIRAAWKIIQQPIVRLWLGRSQR